MSIELDKHLPKRILEVWNMSKVFMDNLKTSSETVRSKVIFIQGAFSQNSALTPEDVKEDLILIDTLHNEQMLKQMELGRYQAVLAELKFIADLHKIEVNITEEEKEAYKAFSDSVPNLYAVIGNELQYLTGEEQKIAIEQIKQRSASEERLTLTFENVVRKH